MYSSSSDGWHCKALQIESRRSPSIRGILLTPFSLDEVSANAIVGYPVEDGIEVVDGFHRHRVGKESKPVRNRVHGYLPVTWIKSDRSDIKDRMASTIRHNRARGVHGVIPMADMVASLIKQGWTDADIAQQLGMDADEVLRFKQNLGLPELFKEHEFSPSWE